MKMLFRFRVPAVGFVLWLALANPGYAQDDFKIVGLRPVWSTDLIHVGSDWRKDLPKRMLVSLRVSADTPASAIFVKTYFYDHDDKLVGSYGKPNSVWTSTARGLEEVGLPKTLSHLKATDVYFAIPEDLQAKNWTTVVAVFGNSTKVSASCLPASELPKLDFPEKAKLPPANP
jgi:hypothetical protein